jgi:hypothetical protein
MDPVVGDERIGRSAMHGVGTVERAFPGRSRALGVVQAALGVGVAVVTLGVGGTARGAVVGALLALTYAAVAYTVFARPAVVVGGEGLLLRGEVRDTVVPWRAVDSVEATRTGLRVITGDRAVRARGFSGSPPGLVSRTPGGTVADDPAVEVYCADVAAEVGEAARRHRAAAPVAPFDPGAAPRERTRWGLVALPVVLLVAALLVGLV